MFKLMVDVGQNVLHSWFRTNGDHVHNNNGATVLVVSLHFVDNQLIRPDISMKNNQNASRNTARATFDPKLSRTLTSI